MKNYYHGPVDGLERLDFLLEQATNSTSCRHQQQPASYSSKDEFSCSLAKSNFVLQEGQTSGYLYLQILFGGRLVFRQYIKNKKPKYGIKFYELTSYDGYILNLDIYEERDHNQPDPANNSKTEQLALRPLGPYLNKGHHVYMNNFYSSVSLSSKLLTYKTHSTGTLRTNRRGNPSLVIKKKLRKGEHIWREKKTNHIYVSKWKDKRDVVAITIGYKPSMVTVRNKYGVEKEKPIEIDAYNRYMSGIDKSDQMLKKLLFDLSFKLKIFGMAENL
ncbi:hypothetical protein NQ318_007014 [Aromia moschata]|uniref:PiggyBac transposable element-derived protein domain-containing protein n=1 Tax=Aromia moschata TaxID=1265417 RepID=A0AAV8Y556_9CUCU|nr:hypothetical protein NQ318_007014 [Aromia moschata]